MAYPCGADQFLVYADDVSMLGGNVRTIKNRESLVVSIKDIGLEVNGDKTKWPCGLRRRSAVARLLRLWVRIPPGHDCLSVVSVVCCQVEVSATS